MSVIVFWNLIFKFQTHILFIFLKRIISNFLCVSHNLLATPQTNKAWNHFNLLNKPSSQIAFL